MKVKDLKQFCEMQGHDIVGDIYELCQPYSSYKDFVEQMARGDDTLISIEEVTILVDIVFDLAKTLTFENDLTNEWLRRVMKFYYEWHNLVETGDEQRTTDCEVFHDWIKEWGLDHCVIQYGPYKLVLSEEESKCLL